jgi:putative transposase
VIIIDSQIARTSAAGGERGYNGGKRIAGRKRHLVVAA